MLLGMSQPTKNTKHPSTAAVHRAQHHTAKWIGCCGNVVWTYLRTEQRTDSRVTENYEEKSVTTTKARARPMRKNDDESANETNNSRLETQHQHNVHDFEYVVVA
jgi:predicted  nucleic acid-binding Zn-ribbon protein